MSEGPRPWTSDHARNVYSQTGEDGIAEALLDRLPARNNWVVEFGAWDGIYLSNSRYFVEQHRFAAVLIEGSSDRFAELSRLYEDRPDVHTINAFVHTSGPDTLDGILSRTSIPVDFDYLSIDIDGNDYHVWASLEQHRPKLVCIEFNPTIAPGLDFTQPNDFAVRHGTGISAFVDLGRRKGYELAAVTSGNLFFVRSELFPLLDIADNSIAALWSERPYVTQLFSGYDGTVFVVGSTELPFHQIPLRLAVRQELPAYLRTFPPDYTTTQRLAFWAYYATRHPADLARKIRRRLTSRLRRSTTR